MSLSNLWLCFDEDIAVKQVGRLYCHQCLSPVEQLVMSMRVLFETYFYQMRFLWCSGIDCIYVEDDKNWAAKQRYRKTKTIRSSHKMAWRLSERHMHKRRHEVLLSPASQKDLHCTHHPPSQPPKLSPMLLSYVISQDSLIVSPL